ncbi:MAG: hypothetical protein NC332_04975 [Firmicutes bacterium]|nr:hypothetical protein [Bacillota bacterium]
MNNTVLVESTLRQKLRLTCVLLCIFCMISIVSLILISVIGKVNLNGQTSEVTGELQEVFKSGSNVLTFSNGDEYNVVWDENTVVDWDAYSGKTITLIVSQSTFGDSNPWIFGLVVEGETVVDHVAVIAAKTAQNNEMKTVVAIITAVMCVGTCAVFIWRFNVKPTTEHPLYEQFAEFLIFRQPVCKQRKTLIIVTAVWTVAFFLLFFAAAIIGAIIGTDEVNSVEAALMITGACIGAIGACVSIILSKWVFKKEIDFYAEKLPFDFSDISHISMRKKYKEELQSEILKDRELNPHTFADGGNGYDVVFGEKGVTLKVPFDGDDMIAPPDAEEVFALNGDPFGGEDVKPNLFFTYGEMNFEAIAHYRKNSRPMMIIIKSRLERRNDFPEEFVNDVHIALDVNLLNTLKEFNVEAENLQYILDNKKLLMRENCFRKSKRKN